MEDSPFLEIGMATKTGSTLNGKELVELEEEKLEEKLDDELEEELDEQLEELEEEELDEEEKLTADEPLRILSLNVINCSRICIFILSNTSRD